MIRLLFLSTLFLLVINSFGQTKQDKRLSKSHCFQLWFVSNHKKLISMVTSHLHNLSGQPEIAGEPTKPNGFFHPCWSPEAGAQKGY